MKEEEAPKKQREDPKALSVEKIQTMGATLTDPKVLLNELRRSVNDAKQISIPAFAALLSVLPRGEDWGWQAKSTDVQLFVKRFKDEGLTAWDTNLFLSLDLVILESAILKLKNSDQKGTAERWIGEFYPRVEAIIKSSETFKNKVENFRTELKTYYFRLLDRSLRSR